MQSGKDLNPLLAGNDAPEIKDAFREIAGGILKDVMSVWKILVLDTNYGKNISDKLSNE